MYILMGINCHWLLTEDYICGYAKILILHLCKHSICAFAYFFALMSYFLRLCNVPITLTLWLFITKTSQNSIHLILIASANYTSYITQWNWLQFAEKVSLFMLFKLQSVLFCKILVFQYSVILYIAIRFTIPFFFFTIPFQVNLII